MNKKESKPDTDVSEKQQGTERLSESVIAIPTALVQPGDFAWSDLLKGSHMWLVALACLLVAIGVVWWSIPSRGVEIEIHFPEGHGLKAEDVVRFRGIDVGMVDEVVLNDELSGVDVRVNLFPFAEPLARDGTRFWIVRPELSLGGISGLETAVGHKYIGLIPGDKSGPRKFSFDGLNASPPDAFENKGIEIIIRGDKRYSVNAGSPVHCRGIVVGRILSVGLSQDGRFVDARARIFEDFTRLVSTQTRFWASGGVDADFSLTEGLKLDVESLETLVQGGVSLLTIDGDGQPVKPGHVFTLYPAPEDKWYELANQVRATDVELRGAVPMEVTWESSGVFSRLTGSDQRTSFVGTHILSGNTHQVIVPADMLTVPEKAVDNKFEIGLAGKETSRIPFTEATDLNSQLVVLEIDEADSYPEPLETSDIRAMNVAESCLAVRSTGSTGELTFLHYQIEAQDIGANGILINFDGDRDVWHGAPVLSSEDGKLTGILLVEPSGSRIAPPPELSNAN